MKTFEKIGVEIRGVMDQPGLAFLQIGTELTLLCWKTVTEPASASSMETEISGERSRSVERDRLVLDR
ncbi:hypothetical protein CsSME_00017235 [Camellia sinensis var. sinensis]